MSLERAPEDLLKHQLTSINAAAEYIGVSRAKFYVDILPHLKTVRLTNGTPTAGYSTLRPESSI